MSEQRSGEHWEYQSWLLYGVCQGCGAAYASMHALECPDPGRADIEVVPASQLEGAVEDRRKLELELAATRRALFAEVSSWWGVERAVKRHCVGRGAA